MKTVGEVLEAKGHDVWSVSPNTTVFKALEEMADKNIGAMVVQDGDGLIGMFSERDYARKVILVGKTSMETLISEVMSTDVVCVKPKQSVGECMVLMTKGHIRHLPVCRGNGLIGVISIQDVVKAIIGELEFTVDQLENYIAGSR